MKKFGTYLKLQMKRMGKAFPTIFFMTVLLAGGFCLLAWMQVRLNREDPGKQKITLGIVGDTGDSYLGLGIYALEHMDSSRFALSFVELDEKEAGKQLEQGKISGYFCIPEGFVQSVVNGENLPVTFVGGGSQGGLGTELIRELSESVSAMITETQAGIYSMQEFYLEQDALETIYEDIERLNLRYFDVVLSREKLYEIKQTSGMEELPAEGYYFCAVFLVFLLVWGMNGGNLLVKKDMALAKVMASRGVGAAVQTGGEFLAFLMLMGANSLGIAAILAAAAGKKILLFVLGSWPVFLCVASMLFLLYNLVEDLISGLLLNFLGAVCLGYLSGCFYPLSYFPRTIQKFALIQPVGIGMNYMERYLLERQCGEQMWKLLGYTVLFLGISVYVRKKKLMR
ncbi:MAG: ABC transporter permease [Clostridiales bacterium]|nr:ABC transporter permease [Clostridiales bacterium]